MLSQTLKTSGSLLDSIDAIRNGRAVALLLLTFIAAALVFAFGGLLARVSWFFFAVFALLAYAVAFYGANAVGMMMMDEARGQPSRPMAAALTDSLAQSHRLILVMLLAGLFYLAGFLALALILFLCKLPVLGPMLYVVVFPVSVVVVGLALFALPTVIFPLAAPAVWSGANVTQCVSQLVAIARRRLITVLLLMIAVTFIAGFVGMLIGAVLLGGVAFTTALSVPILGGAMGWQGMGGMMGNGMGALGSMGGGGSHAMAAMLGGCVLLATAFTLPGLVYLRGACSVYLRTVEGLDLAAEQADMEEKLAAARAKAREMKSQVQATAQQYTHPPKTSAPTAAPTTPPPEAETGSPPAPAPTSPDQDPDPATGAAPAPEALRCPSCQAEVAPDDAFCAECGQPLAPGAPPPTTA